MGSKVQETVCGIGLTMAKQTIKVKMTFENKIVSISVV